MNKFQTGDNAVEADAKDSSRTNTAETLGTTAKLALTVAVAVSVGAVALIAHPGEARADECGPGNCGTIPNNGGGCGGCGCGSSVLIW